MQYTAQTVSDLTEALAPIARIASAYDYFALNFMFAAGPAAKMAALGPRFLAAHNATKAGMAALQWTTVVTSNDGCIVGFAATTEAQSIVKARKITWFFVVPAYRDGGEQALIRHIEQNDAAGCAELEFEAELNIELWRRLLQHGYRPVTPRSYARGPADTIISTEILATGLQSLGVQLPPTWTETARKIRAFRALVADAIALINDELTTVETFRTRYPVLIESGPVMPTMGFLKPLMPGKLCVPAGPAAHTLKPWTF